MQKNEIYLEPDFYYHVYNRAVGDDNLFYSDENYKYFLKKYNEYISPVADTFTFCLMPNHFHFLIRIKSEKEISELIKKKNKTGLENMETNLFVSKQFSNFFNGYSQAINKQQMRNGTLFSRAFKRKQIGSMEYMRNLVIYIHQNPVNHGFVRHAKDWEFSSYNSIVSKSDLELKSDEVIAWFEDLENFTKTHENYNVDKLIKLEVD